MTVPAGITPREQAMYLAAVIKSNEQRRDHLDKTIGSLTEARYACQQTIQSAQDELAVLRRDHYADLEAEAARDQAQGRAEDFRMGGAA